MNEDGSYEAKFVGGNADGDDGVRFPLYVPTISRKATMYHHTGWESVRRSAPGPQPEDPYGEKRPVVAIYEPIEVIL